MKHILLALTLLATTASAGQICKNVYNPMTDHWDFVCFEHNEERNGNMLPRGPHCKQVYDAMNNTWHTVCE